MQIRGVNYLYFVGQSINLSVSVLLTQKIKLLFFLKHLNYSLNTISRARQQELNIFTPNWILSNAERMSGFREDRVNKEL
jgi:hypothetical protein